ncbi:exodeoxyribonuclease VII large subunit [Fructilactobacillus lindneri]|uniref:Exodeoxyribonuclease 7 large subunit n=2 Tax=Fructilactobacillus lindneri TaxID=53444 RepID=A0A0R2JPI2_9LACO|nr:exodeoxyribonuclease VII large subunit [Fructilactobacillus lindneri]ANZ58230.1 exodeoxyribonuclease VII large subunit [Fructilactobacillus lindneri]ANZ59552.1 exodeoxyribonuclease VII large subunit [Fructilactobacillus lindneri]KRN79056.1 Exodeoxyribonuclease 7 large subunit [Fructilactobacillus lindneri DSM 20690 = JCM 11027]POG98664.1 exodeoxyribonuclease VII large subunit [Fructilactobacillus lindneri]POH04052.1 exodeoxyribonuclease VII large subunit [Fructilactobacillus lindneri]
MKRDYLTVTALNQYINQKFDKDPYLNRVYLTGELSNWRKRPGHQYFSVKDDKSVISAVMWKGQFGKIKFEPEEGMKVLITGRVSTFARSGQYQIYVDSMEPDGVGNLYVAYEQLKKKLYDEGLFEQEHKQAIPNYPKRIAVVTSQSGAVIRDIIDAVRKRDPKIQIVLFPAAVQGENAAKEIVNQIKHVNDLGGFDTMIIGRGGGSIEDLWPFNEEEVARAIYDSDVPIISSVGHQTDNTIADFVADIRASTPTQAGVIASPVLNDVIEKIRNNQNALENATSNIIKMKRQQLNQQLNSYIFKHPERLYESYMQQKDILTEKLFNEFSKIINTNKNELQLLVGKLKGISPHNLVQSNLKQLDYLFETMQRETHNILSQKNELLVSKVAALDHLSPLKIMARGYSLVKNKNGKLIKSVLDVKNDEELNIEFKDGNINANVTNINSKEDK